MINETSWGRSIKLGKFKRSAKKTTQINIWYLSVWQTAFDRVRRRGSWTLMAWYVLFLKTESFNTSSPQCHVQKDNLWEATLNDMPYPRQCQVCLCCCPVFNIFSVLANSSEIRRQCICSLWFRWQTIWTLQRASQSQTLQHLLTMFCWWLWSTNSLFVDSGLNRSSESAKHRAIYRPNRDWLVSSMGAQKPWRLNKPTLLSVLWSCIEPGAVSNVLGIKVQVD